MTKRFTSWREALDNPKEVRDDEWLDALRRIPCRIPPLRPVVLPRPSGPGLVEPKTRICRRPK